jgi:hypothetical protein
MIVYGINFSEQIAENKGKFVAGAAAVGMGTSIGMGAFNITGAIALAPFTGGLSLLAGAASAGLAVGGVVTTAKLCDKIDDESNEGKKNISLRNEIRDTNNRLGKVSNGETRKYEEEYQAQIETPVKTSDCIIM